MAYLAVVPDGREFIFDDKPKFLGDWWMVKACIDNIMFVEIPKGTIKIVTGQDLERGQIIEYDGGNR